MTLITPGFTILLFIIIFFVAAFIAYRHNPATYDTGSLRIFLACFTAFGLFMTLLFYYSVVELQQLQQQLNFVDESSRVSTQLAQELLPAYTTTQAVAPGFVASLLPLQFNSYSPDTKTPAVTLARQVLAYQIFDNWQQTLLSIDFLRLERRAHLAFFLQQAHSPLLQEEWQLNSLNFNGQTQVFGDLLFEYSEGVAGTPEAYTNAANALANDSRYLRLF